MAGGNWRLEDWTQRSEVTFCRDKAEEDVRELIVFSASASQTTPVPFERRLRGDDSCDAPFYKVLAAGYTENLDGSAFNEDGACGMSGVTTSFHERNDVSIGEQPFDPVNHLDRGPDGEYSGGIAASGPGTIAGTLHGCDITAEPPFPPCTSDFGGDLTTGPSIRVTIPKDSDTATVQWPLTNVGGNFPGADPACQTDPFRTSNNTEFMVEEQRPASVFLAEGPHTITLGKTRTARSRAGRSAPACRTRSPSCG